MTSVRLMDRVSIALHTVVMKKKSHRWRPNKAGSVLTYKSSLVDPQIRRIETTASKYRGVEQE